MGIRPRAVRTDSYIQPYAERARRTGLPVLRSLFLIPRFEVHSRESAETAAAFPFYDGKDGIISQIQVDLTKHGKIVDVRVDGLDHVENPSFDIENVAHDFDTAKLNEADVPDSRVSPEGRDVILRAE